MPAENERKTIAPARLRTQSFSLGTIILAAIVFTTCTAWQCLACTAFMLDSADGPVMGKNMNYPDTTEGMILINKRDVRKIATINPDYDVTPASWTSRFGSVTFNLWFQDFPSYGINEAGLVIDILQTGVASEFPGPDSRPCITVLQWMQYMLDTYGTVRDVIEAAPLLRLFTFGGEQELPYHYFIGDRQGNCAVIELIDGKMVCYTGSTLPVKALTNSPYARAANFWQQGQQPLPFYGHGYFFFQYDSCHRFSCAADMVARYSPKQEQTAAAYAFGILDTVSRNPGGFFRGFGTQWRIFYNLRKTQITFFTRKNEELRTIDLQDFNFSCESPVKVLGVNTGSSGDISGSFMDLTPEVHREFMTAAPEPWITDEIMDIFLEYFETFICVDSYVQDADNDTVADGDDNCPTSVNPDQLDSDGDTFGDACDSLPLDFDNDGVADATDNCPGAYNPGQSDTDGDGMADACDDDSDADGVSDTINNCPTAPNTDQLDSDDDGAGDVCDNCPFRKNAAQIDLDNAGRGDACDLFLPHVLDVP